MPLTSAERLVVLRDLMQDDQSPHRALALSSFVQRNAEGLLDDLLALDEACSATLALVALVRTHLDANRVDWYTLRVALDAAEEKARG